MEFLGSVYKAISHFINSQGVGPGMPSNAFELLLQGVLATKLTGDVEVLLCARPVGPKQISKQTMAIISLTFFMQSNLSQTYSNRHQKGKVLHLSKKFLDEKRNTYPL